MGVPPFVGVAVKVTLSPAQIVVFPDIVTLAAAIRSTVIAVQLEALVPQLLSAVTHTLPDAVPKVTVIEVVDCPDVIEEPAGTVHV